MLDSRGAYQSVVNLDRTPRKPTPQQKSWQRYYEDLSHDILKTLIGVSPLTIKDDLMEYERHRWKRAGFPWGADPVLDAKMEEIIKSHLGENNA